MFTEIAIFTFFFKKNSIFFLIWKMKVEDKLTKTNRSRSHVDT